jgi:nucleotide-binding universal stress UspA family protein
MLRNFLCCVDGSRDSESGLRHAVNLAIRCAGRVEILHVTGEAALADDEPLLDGSALSAEQAPEAPEELPPPEEGVDRPERMLGRMVEICRAGDVGWTVSSLPGQPADRILQRARVADMVVIGRQGPTREGRESGQIGSTAERVIRRVDRPVLLTTATFVEPKSALVPYARTPGAGVALRLAAEVATHLDAALVVMSAEGDRLKAEQALADAEEYLRAYRLDTEFIYRKDRLEESLPVVCSEQECELIVMGALASGLLRGLGRSSFSLPLLRATRCPVLLCP